MKKNMIFPHILISILSFPVIGFLVFLFAWILMRFGIHMVYDINTITICFVISINVINLIMAIEKIIKK